MAFCLRRAYGRHLGRNGSFFVAWPNGAAFGPVFQLVCYHKYDRRVGAGTCMVVAEIQEDDGIHASPCRVFYAGFDSNDRRFLREFVDLSRLPQSVVVGFSAAVPFYCRKRAYERADRVA